MRRMRRSVRRKLIFGGICIVLQVLLFLFGQSIVYRTVSGTYETALQEKETMLRTAERLVYITISEVKAGELLTEENTEKRYLLSEQNPEAIATEVLGTKACADLKVGVIITESLCCKPEYSSTERVCVYQDIGFAECFSSYDVVDVRLRYANGENYCVLKKKELQKDDDERTCGFYLSEAEQLLMSAARYDIERYEGAELYVVGFMEARLQEDAVSEYLPSVQIITQLKEWDEEYGDMYRTRCERRRELEQRLEEHQKQRREGYL